MMGTNKNPDTAEDSAVKSGDLGGDTDKDPDITGKSLDPQHNTLRMRGRSHSKAHGISDDNAAPSRTDASRGPTNQPHGPETE
jgi:hypothetical protein